MGTRIDFFTEEQCEEIYQNALKILEEIGSEVQHEEALKLLKDSGCTVDGTLVKIPRSVVEEARKTAPKSFMLYDRFGNEAVEFSGRSEKTYYSPAPDALYRIDRHTGERRDAVAQDAADTAILVDNLENVAMADDLAYPSDVPHEIATLVQLEQLLKNTSKPCFTNTFSKKVIDQQLSMAYAIAGGKEKYFEKPFIMCGIPTKPPLVHTETELESFLYLVRLGQPCFYNSSISMGGTGPASLAGIQACGLAEVLVGLVISQLANPGARFVGGIFVDPQNMKTLAPSFSCPEFNFCSAASAPLFRYLNIPYLCHMTGSDSALFDEQTAGDIVTGIMVGEMTHVSFNFFLGFIETAMSSSLQAILYGNEMIGFVRHMFRPIEFDEDALAFEALAEVGPGGDFLSSEHTLDYLDTFWNSSSKLICRDTYDKWAAAGSKTLGQRLQDKVNEIIDKGPKNPLDPELCAKLDAIVEAAKKDIDA